MDEYIPHDRSTGREDSQGSAPWGHAPSSATFNPYRPTESVPSEPTGQQQSSAPHDDEPHERMVLLPLLLYAATCYTTYQAAGPLYCAALMFILTAHELGHFFQTLRCRVAASFPFFIPMPGSPLGTMGAVIAMAPHEGDRRALFDIAISGPIAGLIPSLICCVWGLTLSHVVDVHAAQPGLILGEPLLFRGLSYLIFGPLLPGQDIALHPIGYAGWVGLLITALNLFPIGQLDGGHVLYALLRKKAHLVAKLVLAGVIAGVVLTGNWGWILMIALLVWMGPEHPPTANDDVPQGTFRTILGWVVLCFLPFGFTPNPFTFPGLGG